MISGREQGVLAVMKSKRLAASFYNGKTEEVARRLLGKILVHESLEGTTAGRIVEVEAYLSEGDPACHASRGKTKRNAPMFGPPGTAYVYLIYGIHYCFNVVTAPEGIGEAVLVRALEPVAGLDLMAVRRGGLEGKYSLCKGPGNLCAAMGIAKLHNSHDLSRVPLYLADDGKVCGEIVTATRIGISQAAELPLRFYLANSPCVSRK